MPGSRSTAWRKAALFSSLFVVFACTVLGCTGVRLLSEYDEETDRATMALHRQVEALLLDIERNAEEASLQAELRVEEILIDLRVLQLRASVRENNTLQVQQLEELEEQVLLFEKALDEGLAAAEIPLFREGFNQTFRAILTLELAKKRGE